MPEAVKYANLESLLRAILGSICRHTPSPRILHAGNRALFEIQIDGRDQGRCIGKAGGHIWAIQTLFWYAGLAQLGWSYSVILLEPEVEYRGGPEPFRFRKDWDRQKIKNLTDAIILACVPGHACCIIQEEGETSASAQLKMQKYLQLNMAHP